MKKALNLIIMYFVTLIVGILLGTGLYSFYINGLNFIAGTELKLFTQKDLLDAFFFTTFCLLVIICPLVSYYKIRHPGGVPQVIAFIFLSLITWCIAIPTVFNLNLKYISSNDFLGEKESLSKGYFRQVDDKVYYFTKDFTKNSQGVPESTAVIIDTAEDGIVTVQDIIDMPSLGVNKSAAPYREILVKKTFETNQLPITIDFKELFFKSNYHIQCGLKTLIGYLSLALVICSLFALTNMFKWKLLNTLLILGATVCILIFNTNPGLLPFGIIEQKFYNSGFIQFLSQFGTEPLMIFTNYIVAVVFIVTGIVVSIVRNHKNKKRNR